MCIYIYIYIYIYISSSPSVLLSIISLVRLDLAFLSLLKVYFPLPFFRKKKSRNYLKNERVGLKYCNISPAPDGKTPRCCENPRANQATKRRSKDKAEDRTLKAEMPRDGAARVQRRSKNNLLEQSQNSVETWTRSSRTFLLPSPPFRFCMFLTFELSLLPDLCASLFLSSIFLLFHGWIIQGFSRAGRDIRADTISTFPLNERKPKVKKRKKMETDL